MFKDIVMVSSQEISSSNSRAFARSSEIHSNNSTIIIIMDDFCDHNLAVIINFISFIHGPIF